MNETLVTLRLLLLRTQVAYLRNSGQIGLKQDMDMTMSKTSEITFQGANKPFRTNVVLKI